MNVSVLCFRDQPSRRNAPHVLAEYTARLGLPRYEEVPKPSHVLNKAVQRAMSEFRHWMLYPLSGVNYKVALATIRIPDDNYIDFSAAAGGAPVISSPAD